MQIKLFSTIIFWVKKEIMRKSIFKKHYKSFGSIFRGSNLEMIEYCYF